MITLTEEMINDIALREKMHGEGRLKRYYAIKRSSPAHYYTNDSMGGYAYSHELTKNTIYDSSLTSKIKLFLDAARAEFAGDEVQIIEVTEITPISPSPYWEEM